jgi:hypothetical protein
LRSEDLATHAHRSRDAPCSNHRPAQVVHLSRGRLHKPPIFLASPSELTTRLGRPGSRVALAPSRSDAVGALDAGCPWRIISMRGGGNCSCLVLGPQTLLLIFDTSPAGSCRAARLRVAPRRRCGRVPGGRARAAKRSALISYGKFQRIKGVRVQRDRQVDRSISWCTKIHHARWSTREVRIVAGDRFVLSRCSGCLELSDW